MNYEQTEKEFTELALADGLLGGVNDLPMDFAVSQGFAPSNDKTVKILLLGKLGISPMLTRRFRMDELEQGSKALKEIYEVMKGKFVTDFEVISESQEGYGKRKKMIRLVSDDGKSEYSARSVLGCAAEQLEDGKIYTVEELEELNPNARFNKRTYTKDIKSRWRCEEYEE